MTAFDITAEFDFNKLEATFDSIDPERAGKRAVTQVAEDLLEQVKIQINASEIDSPARLRSDYEHGPGPSLVKTKPYDKGTAWEVHHEGGMQYTVKPRPKVRQRAIILEEGMDARERSGEEGPYRFLVDGVPKFTQKVDAVKAHKYWAKAVQKVGQENRLDRYFINNMEKQAQGGTVRSRGPL